MLSRLAAILAIACVAGSEVAAYTLTGSHWTSSPVTMQLQLGAPASPLSDGSTTWGAVAENALSIWNTEIGAIQFTVVRNSTAPIAEGNGLNNVFFSKDVYGQAWGTGVLAVTLTYTSGGSSTAECDVLFNSNLQWDSYRGPLVYTNSGAVMDFQRVALHEFGHVLGLDHPDQAGQTVVAIMNSTISNLDALATDDITGAQSLYGPNTSTTSTQSAPVITTQPSSKTVTAGQNVSFSVVASSSTSMTYQWSKNGSAISGATSSTLTLNNVAASIAGNYSVVVSNSAGSTTSNTATLTVNPAVTAPTITTQPASQTVGVGSPASFTVSVSGTSPFSYSWRKNGTAISGATSASYSLSSVQLADAGNYTVVVSNNVGSVTSSTATLTVSSAPVITTQPASQAVSTGTPFTLSVAATGSGSLSYQWYKNSSAISGATTATYSVGSAASSDAGSYAVTVSNNAGSVTSSAALITVNTAPAVTTAPSGQTVNVGDKVVLSVSATGNPAPTYQWQKNGMNIAGATQSTYVLNSATATDSGTYDVIVTNAGGSVTTVPVLITVNYSQLVNLSTRGFIRSGDIMTTGFVLRGASSKPVILRGVGPALNGFGVTNALSDPQIAVIAQTNSQTLAVNSSWSVTPQLSTAFQSVGAFPLPSGSADAASEIQLMPGAYTTQLTSNTSGVEGIALAEVYDADPGSVRTRLVNVSTLGFTGTGDNALVAGFSIQGNAPKRLMIRAVGPSLAQFGVSGLLANPQFSIYPASQSASIGGNDDWSNTPDIAAAVSGTGAFPLTAGSHDAALIVSLQPGTYTVVVTGVGNTTGYSLVEVYDLDP